MQEWSIPEGGWFDRIIFFNSTKLDDEGQQKFHKTSF